MTSLPKRGTAFNARPPRAIKNALKPASWKITSRASQSAFSEALFASGVAAGIEIERELEFLDIARARQDTLVQKLLSAVAELRAKEAMQDARIARLQKDAAR